MHADWEQYLHCEGHGRHLPTQVSGQQQRDGQPYSRVSGRCQWSQEGYTDTAMPQTTMPHHNRSRASRDAIQPTPRQMPDPISGHMAHSAERLQADMQQADAVSPGMMTGQMQQADAPYPGIMMRFQQAWGHDERVDDAQDPMWVPPEQQDTNEFYPVQAPAYNNNPRDSVQQHSVQAHHSVPRHMQQQRWRPQAMQAYHGGAQHMQQQQEGRVQGMHAYQSAPSPMQQQGGGYSSYPPASGNHQQRFQPGSDIPPFDCEYSQGGPPCTANLGAQAVAQQQHGRSAQPAYRRDPDLPEAPMQGDQYVRGPHPRAQAMCAGGMLSSAYAAGPEAMGGSPSHEYPAGPICCNCTLQSCKKDARLALACAFTSLDA